MWPVGGWRAVGTLVVAAPWRYCERKPFLMFAAPRGSSADSEATTWQRATGARTHPPRAGCARATERIALSAATDTLVSSIATSLGATVPGNPLFRLRQAKSATLVDAPHSTATSAAPRQ